MCDTDFADYELGADALEGSILRMLRQGQRVIFDLDADGRATRLRLGSEIDMTTPGRPDIAFGVLEPPGTPLSTHTTEASTR